MIPGVNVPKFITQFEEECSCEADVLSLRDMYSYAINMCHDTPCHGRRGQPWR